MAKRHLLLELPITLDEDLCREAEDMTVGGSTYDDVIDLFRTAVQHDAATILAPFNPDLGDPTVAYRGVEYERADG